MCAQRLLFTPKKQITRNLGINTAVPTNIIAIWLIWSIKFLPLNFSFDKAKAVIVVNNRDNPTVSPVTRILLKMYLVIGIFVLTTVAVYIIRRLTIDHAWKIAIISGVLIQVSGLFAGYMVFNISGKTIGMIIGNIISLLLGFVIEFLMMDLDYERTERLQFEDDDYYYYVKAVPKKSVATFDKKVKQFGNTATKGRKNAHNSATLEQADSRKRIAQELEIDEELLK